MDSLLRYGFCSFFSEKSDARNVLSNDLGFVWSCHEPSSCACLQFTVWKYRRKLTHWYASLAMALSPTYHFCSAKPARKHRILLLWYLKRHQRRSVILKYSTWAWKREHVDWGSDQSRWGVSSAVSCAWRVSLSALAVIQDERRSCY